MGERVNGIDEVRGSNPLSSTTLDKIKNQYLEVRSGLADSPRPHPIRWKPAMTGDGEIATTAMTCPS